MLMSMDKGAMGVGVGVDMGVRMGMLQGNGIPDHQHCGGDHDGEADIAEAC